MVIGHERDRAEKSLAHVLAQLGDKRAEVLIVDSAAELYPPIAGSDHPQVTVLVPPAIQDFGRMKAEAVRQVKGKIVLFIEDHVQAEPGWLDAMLAALDGPWVAVGSQVKNANPDVGLSRVIGLINYGLWAPPVERGEVPLLPGNNTAYRRQTLLDLGDALEALLISDTVLQWKLLAEGGRLFLEANACIRHLHPTSLANCLQTEFAYHWPFAGVRARTFNWSRWKTLRYILLSPAIPWLRLRRSLAINARKRLVPTWQLVWHMPQLILMLHAAVLGQIVGLIRGPSQGVELFTAFELNSPRQVKGG
jgi:hypothetical protein